MTKALIVYGTRYGATANTSEAIADVLREERFEVRVINVKEDKVQSISEYELIIVGSGIRMGSWTKEPEKFLEKFQKELAKKRLALFVCCGSAHPLTEEEEKTKAMEDARRKYLEKKAAKYNLNPQCYTILLTGLICCYNLFHEPNKDFRHQMGLDMVYSD